jgi:nucleotide-binding universal stress UspA family protein
MTGMSVAEGRAEDGAVPDESGRPVFVVGVDGTAPSWDAFAWTAGEALRTNGRILAVFATPLIEPEEALGSTAPLGYAAAADARDQMAEGLAAEVRRRADVLDVDVRFVRGTGDAVHVLTEVAQAAHADLMVVGRSAKALHRLAGSVGRRLVLNRDGPVIVVVP